MKIIEEQNLQNAILQLNTYQKKFEKISEFYHNLDTLEIPSLQNLSFEKDNEFFDEVSLILSVIASIIAKPHLSNKGEDIILRAEQAGHLSNESAGRLLSEIIHDKMKAVLLGHLSHENNYEKLAYETVCAEITLSDTPYKATDFFIQVAKRDALSECISI